MGIEKRFYKEYLFQGAAAVNFKNAIRHRKEPTSAEDILWGQLRNRQLKGIKFRRRHPVDRYIADFYCARHKVIVELDGCYHESDESREYDSDRTSQLEQPGIQVLRFRNEEVTGNIISVLHRIVEFIQLTE